MSIAPATQLEMSHSAPTPRQRSVIVHAAGRSTRVVASEVHAAFLEAGWQADLAPAETLRYTSPARQLETSDGHIDAVVSIGALPAALRFAATQPGAIVLVATGATMIRNHLSADTPQRPSTAVCAAAIQFARRPDEMLLGGITISSSTKGRAVALGGVDPDLECDQVWHVHVEAPLPSSSDTNSGAVTVTTNAPSGKSTVRLQHHDQITIAARHSERLRVLLDDGQLLEVDGPISVRRHPTGVQLIDLTAR